MREITGHQVRLIAEPKPARKPLQGQMGGEPCAIHVRAASGRAAAANPEPRRRRVMAAVAHQAFQAVAAVGGRPGIGGPVAVTPAVEAHAPVILGGSGVGIGRLFRAPVLTAAARPDTSDAAVAASAPRP